MGTIKTHNLAWCILANQTNIEKNEVELIIRYKNKSLTLLLSNLSHVPLLKEGILFSSIHINGKKYRGFPKKAAYFFIVEFQKEWYLSSNIRSQVESFYNLTNHHIDNYYLRSSTFNCFLHRAKQLKSRYHQPPTENLLPNEVAIYYLYIEDVLKRKSEWRDEKRNIFVEKEKNIYKTYFDEVESHPLTNKQREACILNNDANLVLAGAGTGKTSTIVAKAGYLMESGKATPQEILILAFGRDAANEIDRRIKEKLNIHSIKASTFHSLGKSIIKQVEKKDTHVTGDENDYLLKAFIKNEIEKLVKDKRYANFVSLLTQFFQKYSYSSINPFDFDNQEEYENYLEDKEYFKYSHYKKKYKSADRVDGFPTLQATEFVKSHGELLVANFLFLNGIKYVYEVTYDLNKYQAAQSKENSSNIYRSYSPDFYLSDYDIYIEHYGINRNNETAFGNSEKYLREMDWKRKTHKLNGTVCLETFHYEKMEGNLIDNLKNKLLEFNVVLEPINPEETYNKLYDLGEIDNLTNYLEGIFSTVKKRYETVKEARKVTQKKSLLNNKANTVLDIIEPIYDAYINKLTKEKKIDFDLMIHWANRYLRDANQIKIGGEGKEIDQLNYKYILIDEFQDISEPRANLVKGLLDINPSCSLFCVGDDWQSIMQFSGSDINYTTKFKQYFRDFSLVKLDTTYRFNDKLSQISSRFVMQNPEQSKKELLSFDASDENPVITIFLVSSHWSTFYLDKLLKKIKMDEDAVEEDSIEEDGVKKKKKNIPETTILVRNIKHKDYDKKSIENIFKDHEPEWSEKRDNRIKILTVHASKGMEADHIILFGIEKGYLGFPTEIPCCPIESMFLPEKGKFNYAEERRLFYVALTRARKNVFIICSKDKPSCFVDELINNPEYDVHLDKLYDV